MHIATALAEMHSVLKPYGDLWLLVHPPSMVINDLARSLLEMRFRGTVRQTLMLINGLTWHCFGTQIRFPFSPFPYACFQTSARLRKALRKAGFDHITVRHDRFFVVTARKSAAWETKAPEARP
jgi:hypothetical protein